MHKLTVRSFSLSILSIIRYLNTVTPPCCASILLILLGCSLCVHGEPVAEASPPKVGKSEQGGKPKEESVDFTKGFELLIALGLPSLEHAEWTKGASGAPGGFQQHYELQALLRSMKGNGWKIASSDGKPMVLAMGGVKTAPWDKNAEAETTRSKSLLGTLFGAKSKNPKKPDLAADVAAMLKGFEKLGKSDQFRESLRYTSYDKFGAVLIFAAQLHQTGHDDLANQVASKLFELVADREKVLDAAVSSIAERDFEKATSEFFESGDWNGYHERLAALVEKFPRGWSGRLGVAMLLDRLGKRAKGETVSVPSTIDGIPVRPEALAALKQLVEQRSKKPTGDEEVELPPGVSWDDIPAEHRAEVIRMLRQQLGQSGSEFVVKPLWLLGSGAPPEGAPESGKPEKKQKASKSPIERIYDLGIEAIPALAAAVENPTLTYQRNSEGSGGYLSYGGSSSIVDQAERIYRTMDRPMSLGEIATRLLSATLPKAEDDYEAPDPTALRDAALEFYRTHRNENRIQWALVFLAEGDDSQRRQAAGILVSSKNPAAWDGFEKFVLENDSLAEQIDLVEQYLRGRKGAAAPFFKKFSVRMRDEYGDVKPADPRESAIMIDDMGTWRVAQAGGVEKILKRLAVFVGTEDPVKQARKIAAAKDDEDFDSGLDGLVSMLREDSREKCVSVMLEGAAATDVPRRRAKFLLGLANMLVGRSRSGVDGKNSKTPEIPEAQRKHWEMFLADERPHGLEELASEKIDTVAKLAALDYETLFVPDCYATVRNITFLTGKSAIPLLLERARARMKGAEPPPLPDAKNVSEEELKKIVERASKLKPAELGKYLDSLGAEEILAWAKWLGEARESNEGLPKFLLKARSVLAKFIDDETSVMAELTKGSEKFLEASPLKIGMDFADAKALRSACMDMLAKADEFSPVFIYVSANNLGAGLDAICLFPKAAQEKNERHLSVVRNFLRSFSQAFDEEEDDRAILFVEMRSNGGRVKAAFRMDAKGKISEIGKDDEEESAGKDGEPASKENPKDPFEKISKILSDPDTSYFQINISLSTRKDIETLGKMFEEEEEE